MGIMRPRYKPNALFESGRRVIRAKNTTKTAVLGDESNNIFSDRKSFYWARPVMSSDENGNAILGPVFYLRANPGAGILNRPGRRVLYKKNESGDYEVLRADPRDMDEQGIDQIALEPNDAYRAFRYLFEIVNLMSQGIGSGLLVNCYPWQYHTADRTVHFFAGTDATGHVDLTDDDFIGPSAVTAGRTSILPTVADTHRFALLVFNITKHLADEYPLEVYPGVAIAIVPNEPLTVNDDLQTCYDVLPTDEIVIPIKAYYLEYGQTEIAGISKDIDVRQFINVPSPVTIAALSPLTTKGDLFTYSTVNDRLPVGAVGTLVTPDPSAATGLKYETFANVVNPVLLAPGPIGSTTPNTIAGTIGSLIAADAATNTPTTVITLGHNTSGTPAAGYGTKLLFQGESSTTPDVDMAGIRSVWTTATHASRSSSLIFSTWAIGVETTVLTLAPGSAAVTGTLSATSDFTLSGAPGKIKPAANSTTALQIANAAGTAFITLDTSNNRMGVGATPARSFEVFDNANPQMRLSNSTRYMDFSFNSAGNLLLTSDAATPSFGVSGTTNPQFRVTDSTTPSTGKFQATDSLILIGAETNTATAFITNNTQRLIITTGGEINVNYGSALTNSTANIVTVSHNTSGTPAAGFGSTLLFLTESSTTTSRSQATIDSLWITATDASRAGALTLNAYSTTTKQEGFRVEADAGGVKTSVNGAAAVARQTAGAATAGALYTATEQAMLQIVYDAVRNFGITT